MTIPEFGTTVYPSNRIFYIGENVVDLEGELLPGEWAYEASGAEGISVPGTHNLAAKFEQEFFAGTFDKQYLDGGNNVFPADGETFREKKSDGKFRLGEGLNRVPSDELDTSRSIVVDCSERKTGGGAFNAANTASKMLEGSRIPLAVTLFANVYDDEARKDLHRRRGEADVVRYEAMCTCGENQIGRNITFYKKHDNRKEVSKYTFASPSLARCPRCDPRYLFSLRDTVQINSIKDAALFDTIADGLERNKQRFDLKVVACITDSMMKAIAEQDSRWPIDDFIGQLTDVLIVNETELARLLHLDPGVIKIESPEPLFEAIDKWLQFRGKVYLTLGENGIALLLNSRNVFYQEIAEDVKKHEGKTSGCGDSASAVITLLEAENRCWPSQILEAGNAAGQLKYIGEDVTIPEIKAFAAEHRRRTPVQRLVAPGRFERF